MRVISVRENPEYREIAIKYIQSKWLFVPPVIYENSISHSLYSDNPLPQWYLLEKENQIIGCAGLITNDFISRMDLYPWICALFIEESHRGNSYPSLLLDKAKEDTRQGGFNKLYLCTDHVGYYEKHGFKYIGQGYHPWEEESRIYELDLNKKEMKKQEIGFTIRQETEKDHSKVYDLIKTAFETANVKDGDEQDFAKGLWESANYIPELALVAEKDGKLIGHIMFTKLNVNTKTGDYETLLVAPLSVLLEYRNIGVGSALMEEGFKRARNIGYKAAFLCGDPNYYNRFGFRKTVDFRIFPQNGLPEQYTLGCELVPDALEKIEGTVVLT